jgi:hypothetical protein
MKSRQPASLMGWGTIVRPETVARLPGRAKRVQSEHALQRQVADYLNRALPPDAWWSSIDHAGTSRTHGGILKGRGVKRGIPDILILSGAPDNFTIWVELKSAKGQWSIEQKRFALMARNSRHEYFVCRSIEDVADSLQRLGIPLRCRIAA